MTALLLYYTSLVPLRIGYHTRAPVHVNDTRNQIKYRWGNYQISCPVIPYYTHSTIINASYF